MYIELNEELNVPFSTSPTSYIDNVTESDNNLGVNEKQLIVPAEALHSIITGNYTFYEPNCIKESLPLWTSPYKIPIIYNHKDQDSKIIGRVQKAFFIKNSNRTDTPGLGLMLGIGDKEGKEGILNETLLSMSIGAKATDLRCSICGQNLAEHGFCEHEKGKRYDGKLCYWVVKKMIPREVSYVTVPSDRFAYSEAPISHQDFSVSESLKNDEVNEMSIKDSGIFHDLRSEILAEQQEKALLAEAEKEEKVKEEPAKEETKKEVQEPKETKVTDKEQEEAKVENKETTEEPKKEEETKVEDKKEDTNLTDLLQKKIEELEKELETLKKLYNEEKKLRESAECKLVLIEAEQKKELACQINELRVSLGLQEKDSSLLIQTDLQVLNNEVNNLKEYSNSTIAGLKEMQVKNPTVVDENSDNTIKEIAVKEHEEITLNTALKFNNFIKRK